MNRRDAFDANLASWLDDAAAAAIPAGLRDGVMAGITEGSPLPAPVAGRGSHWLPTAPGLVELERWSIRLPVRRSSAAVLLLALLTIALIGGAVLVGSRLPQHRSGAGRLAYGLDGDIYLADADGRDPVRVADGALTGPGPSFGLVGWAPDGSHLVYLESGADAAIAHITDVDGKATASFTLAAGAFYPGLQWSPDSTRLQGWDGGGTGFGIYGLDGRRQAFLPLPAGLGRFRETPALWAPDGRSLIAHLGQTSALNGASQTWDLPVVGSPPRRLADDDPRASSSFDVTRDGSRVAFVTAPTQVAPVSLYVANADGTDRRLLVNGSGSGLEACTPSDPRWSPDETRVLYDCYRDPDVKGPRIVDVASGTVHALVDVLPASVTQLGWSPAGDQVLFVTLDTTGHGSLWTINSDGSRQTLLVDGASEGSWQWVQPGRQEPTPMIVPPTPAPAPTTALPRALGTLAPSAEVRNGQLAPGRYEYLNVDSQGFNLQFTVPAGWTWDGRSLSKGGAGGATISFFGGPLQVYTDPCHWAAVPATPPAASAANLVAALAAQPGRGATTPIDRPFGDWAGMAVELWVPDSIDIAGCDKGQYRSWGPESMARSEQGPGQHDLIWAVDIPGVGLTNDQGSVVATPAPGGLVIDAASFAGTPADVMAEVETVLKSIYMGHWG